MKLYKVYLVGGYVRDKILGKDLSTCDKDYVVVGATPADLLEQGYRRVGKNFPVFIHPVSGDEYALARKEVKTGHGYKEFEFIFTPDITLEQDLKRRDFTINAMAICVQDSTQQVIDPYDGQSDLKSKKIKHVSKHFCEDPLRVLRAARFASVLGFQIADETQLLIKEIVDSGEIKHLTNERVLIELKKTLLKGDIQVFVEFLKSWGAFKELFGDNLNDFKNPNNLNHIEKEILFFLNFKPTILKKYKLTNKVQSSVKKINKLQEYFFKHGHQVFSKELYETLRLIGFLKIDNKELVESLLKILGEFNFPLEAVWLESLLDFLVRNIDTSEMSGLKGRDYGDELASRYIELINRFNKSKPLK